MYICTVPQKHISDRLYTSVTDPNHHFDADSDPGFYFNADPDPTFQSDAAPDPDTDSDPTTHFYRFGPFNALK